MIALLSAVLQIIYLLLKNKFEKNTEEKKRKEDLHEKASEAIKSCDTSRIIGILDQLRN